MYYLFINRYYKKLVKMVCTLLFLFSFLGCSGLESNNYYEAETGLLKVQSIDILSDQNPNNINVIIKGNGKLKYTTVKQDFPLAVLVYLPETVIQENILSADIPKHTGISQISYSNTDDLNKITELKIFLKENFPYQVIEQHNSLKISFHKPRFRYYQPNNGNLRYNNVMLGHSRHISPLIGYDSFKNLDTNYNLKQPKPSLKPISQKQESQEPLKTLKSDLVDKKVADKKNINDIKNQDSNNNNKEKEKEKEINKAQVKESDIKQKNNSDKKNINDIANKDNNNNNNNNKEKDKKKEINKAQVKESYPIKGDICLL